MMGNLLGNGLVSSLFDKGANDMSATPEEETAKDVVGSGNISTFVKTTTMKHLKGDQDSPIAKKKTPKV